MKLASLVVVAILHSQNFLIVFAANGGLREKKAVSNDIPEGEEDRMLQSYCGGGNRGNGVCANRQLCCSQWGYCGTGSTYCSGGTAPSPTPPTTSGSGQSAYITYHEYKAGQSLTTVSCSDGSNGLMTRWGYTTLDSMLPYVGAVSNIAWNSKDCGNCYALSANGKTVYITAIDGCGSVGGYALHFDLHPTAFTELLGQTGVNAGHGTATATKVSSSYCRGNKG